MKQWISYTLGLFGLLLFSLTGKAQSNFQPVSLEYIFETCGAQNQTVAVYKQRQALAAAKVEKAKEWWLPDLYAGLQTHQLWGAAMNGNGNFFTGVSRNNIWAGVGVDAAWDFADGVYKVKGAELRQEASQYMTEAVRAQVILESIEAYYDLLAAQLYYDAYDQLAKQADTIAQQIAVQVDAGLRYESELLLAQSNIHHMKVEVLNASVAFAQRSGKLVELLDLDPNVVFVCVDSILAPLELISEAQASFDMDEVYAARPEIKGMELNIDGLEQDRRTETEAYRYPELRLNGYGSMFGRINGPITSMTPDLVPDPRQLYPTAAVNVSLMWRLPTGRWAKGGDLQQFDTKLLAQRAQVEQMEAQINGEVVRANGELRASKQQMAVALEGSKLAEKALSQSIQRQQLRTVQPLEILQAQEMYIQARLDYLRAVTTYNKAQYRLYVAKGGKL